MNLAPMTSSSKFPIGEMLKSAHRAKAACYENREKAYTELQNCKRRALNADVDIRDAEDSIESLNNLVIALGPALL
jgi:hypothetical protein